MYIYKIEIENFRNLEMFSWKPNSGVNLLFGHNGCGKTNLAEAISLVFSTNNFETYFDPSDFYLGDTTKQIRIRIWLDDFDVLPIAISEHLQHVNENDEFIPDDAYENCRAFLIYQLESGIDRVMEWRFFQQTQPSFCKVQERKAVNFILIDANRQPTKEVGLQTRSTFYKMAKGAIGPELERISQELVSFAEKELSQSKVISEYLDTLKMLGEVDLIDKFELLLKNPDSSWTSSGYELGTSVGNAKFSFERQSKGIQNLFLLLLMKKRLEGSAIVFIEELEQNLEPKYQRYIIEEYKSLAVGQLFITSHSPDAISHFDYKSINNFIHKEAINLQTELEKVELKEIHRANKKEFISALMSATILLVEGDSEYESFPIYSYHCGKIFSVHDIEIVRVGGKGKFEKYINIFKKFGKTVYVLIDNDPDSTRKIKDISKIADVIFVSQNSYEDLIFPYITIIADKLEEVIDFSIVKTKLLEIESYDCDKDPHTDAHKKHLHESIIQQKIDVSAINSYSDLCRYRSLLIFTLHNSFASAYFARTIASLIAETGSCPKFFIRMMEHIKPKGKKLEAYGQYKNVFTVNG